MAYQQFDDASNLLGYPICYLTPASNNRHERGAKFMNFQKTIKFGELQWRGKFFCRDCYLIYLLT